MTITNEHPWQSGPRELFQFAINANNSPCDGGSRIAFLLIDVCVETTFRTFLSLPERISGSGIGYPELRRYAAGNFHELAKGVGLAAGGKVSDDELNHVRFYHGVRNRLYHEGNGITVGEEYVRGYGTLVANLLNRLLGVDGEEMLPAVWKKRHDASSHALADMRKGLKREIDRFQHLINLVMEHSEPRMIYPSTVRKLAECSEFDIITFGAKLQSFRQLLEENISNEKLRAWLLEFLADDVNYDRPQAISNSQLIMELGKDPVALYSVLVGIQTIPLENVSMETLDNWDDISYIRQDDYSIMGLYESAKFFEDMFGGKHWFGISEAKLMERCGDLRNRLEAISERMERRSPA